MDAHTPPSEQGSPARRGDVLHRLGAVAALLVLAALLTLGAWRLWVTWTQSRVPVDELVDAPADRPFVGDRAAMRRLATRFAAAVPDGLHGTGNQYMAKVGDVRMRANRNARGDWHVLLFYQRNDLIPQEDLPLLRGAERVRADAKAAADAGVSAQQVTALKALGPVPTMAANAAQVAQIQSLFLAYLKALGIPTAAASPTTHASPTTTISQTPASAAAERKLVEALNDLGQKSLQPTRAATAAYVAKIQQLGPDLDSKLKQAGR